MTTHASALRDFRHPDTRPDLRILHVSDLHFGPPFVHEVADQVLKSAWEIAPDTIVVSGDLTQRARREQFLAAREFLLRAEREELLTVLRILVSTSCGQTTEFRSWQVPESIRIMQLSSA